MTGELYVLSGAPRTGKSTLHRSIQSAGFPGDTVSLDAATAGIEKWGGERVPMLPTLDLPDGEWMQAIRRRDAAIWRGMREWITRWHREDSSDLLLTGAIWPYSVEYVTKQHRIPVRMVVLVDTSPRQIHRLRHIIDTADTHNWQADWPQQRVQMWADKNVVRSAHYARDATYCGYGVVDLADYYDPANRVDYTAAHNAVLNIFRHGVTPQDELRPNDESPKCSPAMSSPSSSTKPVER